MGSNVDLMSCCLYGSTEERRETCKGWRWGNPRSPRGFLVRLSAAPQELPDCRRAKAFRPNSRQTVSIIAAVEPQCRVASLEHSEDVMACLPSLVRVGYASCRAQLCR